ncbi:MAG: hypothetical protein D6813_03260 [Calditrichaeota bacterium]|nr:MAG: hypothetical protein D6813_03260 [Calditrichota bacterium]
MILASIRSGFVKTFINKRLIFIFYLANLLFGLILTLPFRFILDKFAGHSLMGAKLAGQLDMDFLFEFFKQNPNLLSTYEGLLLILPLTYWLVSLFLSGGALSVFARDEKYQASLFWSSAGQYFGRFIRLGLWSIPVAVILFLIPFIATGLQRLIFGSDPYEYVIYWGDWIRVGLRFLSLILFFMVFDYARIYTVLNDERRMRRSLWQGLKFAFLNLSKTFSLAFLLLVAGVLVLILYNFLADILKTPQAIVILGLFIVQQLYMAFRMLLKLTLYASEINLYKSIKEAEPLEVSPADDAFGLEGNLA